MQVPAKRQLAGSGDLESGNELRAIFFFWLFFVFVILTPPRFWNKHRAERTLKRSTPEHDPGAPKAHWLTGERGNCRFTELGEGATLLISIVNMIEAAADGPHLSAKWSVLWATRCARG